MNYLYISFPYVSINMITQSKQQAMMAIRW